MALRTVLVVEDNDAVRELIRLALAETGRRIVVAGSGAEAVEAARWVQVDLLMSDVVLPDTNGPELARTIRAQHRDLHVIYISGWYDHASFPDQLDGPLVTKPFSLDELRGIVAETLGDGGRRDV